MMSRNYNLPRHRSKVKHGKSDSSDHLYPWLFALTKYEESQGGHGTGKLSKSIVPSTGLQTDTVPVVQSWWRMQVQYRLISTSLRHGRSGTIRCGGEAAQSMRPGRLRSRSANSHARQSSQLTMEHQNINLHQASAVRPVSLRVQTETRATELTNCGSLAMARTRWYEDPVHACWRK